VSWLLVDALGKQPMPANAAVVGDEPTEDELSALLQSLAPAIKEELRDRAEFAVGLIAVAYQQCTVEIRASVPGVGFPGRAPRTLARWYLSEVVGGGPLLESDFNAAIKKVWGALGLKRKVRNVLRLASWWYLQARLATAISVDRFTFAFLCLETLCQLASKGMEAADIVGFAALEKVAQERPEIAAYVRTLKSRCSSPSIGQRFGRLADEYSLSTAEADKIEFGLLKDTRNDLFHARISELADVPKEQHMAGRAMALATRYLSVIVERLAAEQASKGS
jgi:hypothetical protein